jgi:ribosomal protein S18 acetylase RimI-like enzyme
MLRARGAPFCVVLRHEQDARFHPLVEELTLRRSETLLPGMALHPIPRELPTGADGLEIRVVDNAAALHDHAMAASRGFEVDEEVAIAIIGTELWKVADATVYTGYADGQAVAAGYSVRSGSTLGIFTIATVPEARGRGFGSAMTGRICADGAAAGCSVVVLQASAMGRPIYERLGFRLVQPYEIWLG